jgi:cytoskeleton protein RodZ
MIDKALGEKLRIAREAKGITFEEASQRTRMRAALIQALESGNLAAFPNPAYAKNFLLLYGKYLGVDVSEMACGIDTEHNVTVKNYQYLAHTKDTTQGPAKRSDFARVHSLPSWGPVIGVALIAAVGIFGSMLWLNMRRIDDAAVAPLPAKVEAKTAVEQIVAPAPVQEPAPSAVVATQAPTAGKAPEPIVATQADTLPPQPTVTKIDGIEVRTAKVLSPVARLSTSDVDVLAKIDATDPATAPQTPPPLTDLTPLDSGEDEEESPLAKDPNTVEIEPLKKTWIVIRTAPGAAPIFEDYLYPSARAMRLPAGKYIIEARDADAIEIRKSGRAIAYTAGGLRVE